jgi:hypothetical protein
MGVVLGRIGVADRALVNGTRSGCRPTGFDRLRYVYQRRQEIVEL